MGITLPFQLILLLIYGTIYMVDPDFRESEKIRIATEKNRIADAQNRAMIEANLFKETPIDSKVLEEMNRGVNLATNCFQYPFYCASNKEILKLIETDYQESGYKNKYKFDFLKSLRKKNKKIFYGCFCRKNLIPRIYDTCPVNDLDQFCEINQECYSKILYEFDNSKDCREKFDKYFTKMKLSNDFSGIKLNEGIKIQKMRDIYSSMIFNDLIQKME